MIAPNQMICLEKHGAGRELGFTFQVSHSKHHLMVYVRAAGIAPVYVEHPN